MGIFKNLFGEPKFVAEANSSASSDSGSAPAKKPEATVVKTDEAVAPADAAATESSAPEAAAETAPKAAPEAAPESAPAAQVTSNPLPDVDPIQALVQSAIAQAAAANQQETAEAQTFATDYLLTPTMKGRRRPGPSVGKFMDMVNTMGRR